MPTVTDIRAWIARLNYVADLPEAERAQLRKDCADRGYHIKSGERFLTANPIHICAHCTEEFQDASHQ